MKRGEEEVWGAGRRKFGGGVGEVWSAAFTDGRAAAASALCLTRAERTGSRAFMFL